MPDSRSATCVGLYLFTRILIPDVILTLTITMAMYGFLRTLEPDEKHYLQMGIYVLGGHGGRAFAERSYRCCVSRRHGVALSVIHQAVRVSRDLATAASFQGIGLFC